MIKQALPVWLLALLLNFLSSTAGAVEYIAPDTNGNPHSLSQYRGKWLVVNFWATWCNICMQELPELADFHVNNRLDAVVVGINFEVIDRKQLSAFVSAKKLPFPVLTAIPVKTTPLGPVPALPTTYIIDPEGLVVAGETGIVTRTDLEAYIRSRNNSRHPR